MTPMQWARWRGLWLSALLGACALAHAAVHRVALVIGNDSYQRSPRLANARNDATAVAAKLKSLGFSLVGDGSQLDVKREKLLALIRQFADGLSADDVALFYFAGHGVAGENQNWLLPVDDGDIKMREDVPDFAVSALVVLQRLQARGGGVNVIILDACRNNPLPDRRRSAGGTRGLAPMQAPFGSFVAYAAGLGEAALDGEGSNGLFTRELLAQIGTPGLRIDDMFMRVRNAVRTASGGEQTPWSESSLADVFYMVPGSAPAQSPSQATAVPPAPTAHAVTAPTTQPITSGAGAARWEGSVWKARLEPNIFPGWKDCPGMELILAPQQRLGYRCTANEMPTYIPENAWHGDGRKLEIAFANGTLVYKFSMSEDTRNERRGALESNPGVAMFIRQP